MDKIIIRDKYGPVILRNKGIVDVKFMAVNLKFSPGLAGTKYKRDMFLMYKFQGRYGRIIGICIVIDQGAVL